MAKKIEVDPLSAQSLHLKLSCNGIGLGSATGFIVQKSDTIFLITNWHVLSGTDPDSGVVINGNGAIPDTVHICFHRKDCLGRWAPGTEQLIKDGKNCWHEHPRGREIDIVALPLTNLPDEIHVYPFDLALAEVDMICQVATTVSIIGFPFGLSSGGEWPIWKTGHIATDIDIDYQNKPVFLIDATTRGGMSGSPVVARVNGGYRTSKGYVLAGGLATKFLGVYAGRIHSDSEIGRVWRPSVLHELLDNIP